MVEPSHETRQPQPVNLAIRPIAPQDDEALMALVLDTLTEFGCVGPGYASSDPEVRSLYTFYNPAPEDAAKNTKDRAYWVVVDEDSQAVLGGAGFSRLKGTTETEGICELQKVYFRPSLRGLGFGRKILERCIQEAAMAGYRLMYLESVPQMSNAVGIYEKLGFQHLSTPLGNTGHTSCAVFMSRELP
jgi:putative acetyltransferase